MSAYMKIIEETTTWTCPKTADYEIICVAGGEGGGNETPGGAGGSTSFGSYLTASGVWGSLSVYTNGGMGGYTLFAYGGAGGGRQSATSSESSPSINGGTYGTTGLGYGAGGNGRAVGNIYAGGRCGRLMSTFVTIAANAKISCVIGVGGAAGTGTGNCATAGAGVNGVIVIREV